VCSQQHHLATVAANVFGHVPGVDDHLRMLNHVRPVDDTVVGDDKHAVSVAEYLCREWHRLARYTALIAHAWHKRVVIVHKRAISLKDIEDLNGWRLPPIVDIFLKSHANHENPRVLHHRAP